jgi:hypothetical protein
MRSFVTQPILYAFETKSTRISEISAKTGIAPDRVKALLISPDSDGSIEEFACLAALCDQELSIVPSSKAPDCILETVIAANIVETGNDYAQRVVRMVEKIADHCLDVRLASQLPLAEFARSIKVHPSFVKAFADIETASQATISQLHHYLSQFGMTLASFPARSNFTNYYRALAAENAAVSPAPALKVA